MAKSVAVLQWRDIQVLVNLCSQSVSQQDKRWEELESVRHDLIEALLEYLQEWLPGKEMENHRRRKLIKALKAFSIALTSREDMGWTSNRQDEDPSALEEIHAQCSRIGDLLTKAIETTGESVDETGSGGGSLHSIAFPLFCLASQFVSV